MKKIFKLLAVALPLVGVLASCGGNEPVVNPPKNATTLSIDPTSAAGVAARGAEPIEITVTSDGKWMVVNSLAWVSVEPASGNGNATVTVTVADNYEGESMLAPRSGSFSIVATETLSSTFTISQEGDPELLVAKIPYEIDFKTDQTNWTIEDVLVPEALTTLWLVDPSYGYKASGFANNTSYASEGWLISPTFDLTDQSVAILSFSHAMNKSKKAPEEFVSVWVKKTSDTDWTPLTVPTYPAGTSWTFVDSGEIDLSEYCGDKIKLGFRYTSEDGDSGTWEIGTLKIGNDASPKFGVEQAGLEQTVNALTTTAKFNVTGNVDWTVECPDGVTANPAGGKGVSTVTLTFPKNEGTENVVYEVTVKTVAAVDVNEFTVRITQTTLADIEFKTLAEVIAEGPQDNAAATDVLVVAVGSTNSVFYDGTAYMYAYDREKVCKVGDKVKLIGATTIYNGVPEWNNPGIEVLSSNNAVDRPEPATLDEAALAALAETPVIKYAYIEGAKDGYYITLGEQKVNLYSNETLPNGDYKIWGYTIGYYAKNACTNFVVSSYEADLPVDETVYKNCAELSAAIIDAGQNGGEFKVDFEDWVEVTYINGKYEYVQDAKGGLLLYGDFVTEFAKLGGQGLRFKGALTVTGTTYRNNPQVTGIKAGTETITKDWNATWPCATLTLSELLTNFNKYVNCKVKVDGVSVTDGWQGSTDQSGKVKVGDNEINVFAKSKTDTLNVKTGCEGNIVGWPAIDTDGNQICFWPADYAAGKSFFTVTKEATGGEGGGGDEEPVYTNCGELNAAILAGATEFKCNFSNWAEITLGAYDEKSLFVQDATGGVLIYNADLVTALKTKAGKSSAAGLQGFALKGEFSGGATLYSGLPEVTSLEIGANTTINYAGNYPCKTITSIADLLADYNKYMNCKVVINGVDVTDGFSGTDRNGKVKLGDSEIAVYVKNTGVSDVVTTGSKGKIVAWVGINNGTKQLTFWNSGNFTASSMVSTVTMPTSASLEPGATLELKATTNSTATITYSSSNKDVATVSEAGVVTAVAVGEADITASVAADGVYTAASAVCKVSVVADAVEPVVLSFPDDNSANNKVTDYTTTWTAKKGAYSWTLSNFNNNNWNNWTYIKCGKKNTEQTATIDTDAKFSNPVKSVVISPKAMTKSHVVSISLITATDAAFSQNVKTEVTLTPADEGFHTEQDVTFAVGTPSKDLYYRLEFKCNNPSTSNGSITLNAVTYNF